MVDQIKLPSVSKHGILFRLDMEHRNQSLTGNYILLATKELSSSEYQWAYKLLPSELTQENVNKAVKLAVECFNKTEQRLLQSRKKLNNFLDNLPNT